PTWASHLSCHLSLQQTHHRSDRRQYGWDIRRSEMLQRLGWIVVRVVAGDRPADIIARVREARARRA
ncbi:hypothetical protein BI294_03600, partial [Mycobacterium avium subsp. hominissuis]